MGGYAESTVTRLGVAAGVPPAVARMVAWHALAHPAVVAASWVGHAALSGQPLPLAAALLRERLPRTWAASAAYMVPLNLLVTATLPPPHRPLALTLLGALRRCVCVTREKRAPGVPVVGARKPRANRRNAPRAQRR